MLLGAIADVPHTLGHRLILRRNKRNPRKTQGPLLVAVESIPVGTAKLSEPGVNFNTVREPERAGLRWQNWSARRRRLHAAPLIHRPDTPDQVPPAMIVVDRHPDRCTTGIP